MIETKHTLVLADGEHRLAWNMNAKIALKQETGINTFSAREFSEYLRTISHVEFEGEGKDARVKDIVIDPENLRVLVWALLLDENTKGWEQEPTLTIKRVGALLPAEDLNPVLEAVFQTITDAQSEASKEKARPFAGDGEKPQS